jgi:drug/metabolite transporter (DMT)-like permease
VIVASFPAITLAGERIVYKTPITARQLAGIVVAMAGVYLISVSSEKRRALRTR